MIFNWYKLFSLSEFLATGLVSRNITVVLDGIGEKEILITRGNEISVMYADTFLPIQFNDQNPYARAGTSATYAVFLDDDENVWLGIEAPA